MSELKPCPFCGGEANTDSADNSNHWWVYCEDCGSRGPSSGHGDPFPADSWNERIAPSAPADPAMPSGEWLDIAEAICGEYADAFATWIKDDGNSGAEVDAGWEKLRSHLRRRVQP